MARKIYVACICEANVDISIGMTIFLFLKKSHLCVLINWNCNLIVVKHLILICL